MTELIAQNDSVREIVFISDLHFDFTDGKFNDDVASQMKDDFIAYIKERYSDCLLCLAGDFFNNYQKTLDFVKELEQNRILGFFVLGNHDYWNNEGKTYSDIIRLFSSETSKNQHFKFLTTGRKYCYDDICVIGDTGWTSFRRKGYRVELEYFMGLPDAFNVKNFNPEDIITMHDEWISFANGVLASEKKVLILSHFPMLNFTRKDTDCWWSSQTDLTKGDKRKNSWRIFGHTHKEHGQKHNNTSSQRGYSDRFTWCFGKLIPVLNQNNLTIINNTSALSKHYSPNLVSSIASDLDTKSILSIKVRGYRRCSKNIVNLAALAKSPDDYIERVKREIVKCLPNIYIGYRSLYGISNDNLTALYSSVSFLEHGNTSDIKAFMTAAIITGYAYNGVPHLLWNMRPLDDYDVIRFWLMFATMKKHEVSAYSVQGHPKNKIPFCNVELRLPIINEEYSLSVEEAYNLMWQIPSLPPSIGLGMK